MNIQEQAKIIRREGQYITRMEGETDKGFESTFEVKWQGDLWTIIMLNGEVISLDKANDNGLSVELAHRKAVGQNPVKVNQMEATLNAIGYTLDRNKDCYSQNRWVTGDRTGESFPAINTGVRELDSGLSAWNVDARRDNNFKALQELRKSLFAVVRGRILQI